MSLCNVNTDVPLPFHYGVLRSKSQACRIQKGLHKGINIDRGMHEGHPNPDDYTPPLGSLLNFMSPASILPLASAHISPWPLP